MTFILEIIIKILAFAFLLSLILMFIRGVVLCFEILIEPFKSSKKKKKEREFIKSRNSGFLNDDTEINIFINVIDPKK